MAYVRKTKDRVRLRAAQLRRRSALIAAGMRARELDILGYHDIDQLTYAAIGLRLNLTGVRVQQIFNRAYRKMLSPSRRAIASPKSP
jgi:DNA-directed RNA polymerase sigma subunit (sigma70/sigma32)